MDGDKHEAEQEMELIVIISTIKRINHVNNTFENNCQKYNCNPNRLVGYSSMMKQILHLRSQAVYQRILLCQRNTFLHKFTISKQWQHEQLVHTFCALT